MATKISRLREEYEKRGKAWNGAVYDRAVSKYGSDLELDEQRPSETATLGRALAQNAGTAPQAPTNGGPPRLRMEDAFNFEDPFEGIHPAFRNFRDAILPGLTAGLIRGPSPEPAREGAGGLERAVTEQYAPMLGQFAGMGVTLPLLPAKIPTIGGRLGPLLARMAGGAQRLGAYEAISGGAGGMRDGGIDRAATGALESGIKGVAMGAGFGAIPQFPKWLGGQAGHSGAIGTGLALAEGASVPEALGSGAVFALGSKLGLPSVTRGGKEIDPVPKIEKPGKVVKPTDVLRSVSSRLERMSPESKRVGEMLRQSAEEGEYQAVGEHSTPLVRSGISKLNPTEDVALGRALDGKLPAEQLPPKAQRVYAAIRGYLSGVPTRATEAEMEVSVITPEGKTEKVPFPADRPDYFPHIVPEVKALKKGPVRDQILKAVVDDGKFAAEAEAAKAMDSFIEIAETGGRTRNLRFAEYLVESGQAETVEQAVGKILMRPTDSKQRRFGPAEYARQFDNPFYDRSARRSITTYIKGMERRIAESKYLGQNSEKLEAALGQIKSAKERDIVEQLISVARRTTKPGDPVLADLLSRARGLAALKLGAQTSIRNLGQEAAILLRTDLESWAKGLATTGTRAGKTAGHASGATAGPTLADVEGVGGKTGRYFRGIGFTQSESFLRTHAANAGMHYAEKMAQRYARNPKDSWAERELRAMKIVPEEVAANGGRLTDKQMLGAGFRISMDTQHSYHPLDLPESFTATELGKTMAQFKPFGVQQARLLTKQTIDYLRPDPATGKRYVGRFLRNVGILATIYPMTGEVINDILAIIKGQKRTSEPLQRYFENAVQVGAFGIMADAYSAANYGTLPNWALGPALGIPFEVADIGRRISKSGMTDANARQLIRRIPGIGPLIAYRLVPKEEDKPKSESRQSGVQYRGTAYRDTGRGGR